MISKRTEGILADFEIERDVGLSAESEGVGLSYFGKNLSALLKVHKFTIQRIHSPF